MPKATEAQLARTFGVARQTIHNYVKSGVLAKDAEGLIDIDRAKLVLQNALARTDSKILLALQKESSAAAAPPPAPSTASSTDGDAPITSYHVAKTLRETAEAGIAKLKLAELAGDLIRKEPARRAVFDGFRMLRDQAFAAPQRAAVRLIGESDARRIESIIAEELRRAFERWDAEILDRLAKPRQLPPAERASDDAEAAPA